MLLRLVLPLVLLLAPGCSSLTGPGAELGDALGSDAFAGGKLTLGPPVPPGSEWLMFFAFVSNTSDAPVTLLRAELEAGRGLGSVVEVVGIRVAPLRIPGGIYRTDPPVAERGDNCRVLKPRPVNGYRLDPGDEGRLLVHLRARQDGEFDIPGHVVMYEQAGSRFIQQIGAAHAGTVAASGKPLRVYPEERRCLPKGGKRLP